VEAAMLALVFGALYAVPVYVCWRMGKRKGRQGIWWGLLLGWLGPVFLAFNFPPKR
jgi:hypothetical protein